MSGLISSSRIAHAKAASFGTLNVVDELSRACPVIRGGRGCTSTEVIDVLTDLFISRSSAAYIRSDNGREFIAKTVKAWNHRALRQAAYIGPGSPWENGCVESFNGRLP